MKNNIKIKNEDRKNKEMKIICLINENNRAKFILKKLEEIKNLK